MKVSMDKLIKLIEQYGEDYLGYGTKEDILSELRDGNQELANKIVTSLDDEWIKRLNETKKFYILDDLRSYDEEGNILSDAYYEIGYMADNQTKEDQIPKLSYVAPREHALYKNSLKRRDRFFKKPAKQDNEEER